MRLNIFLKSDIVSLKNTMSPQQKNISIIHNCENHFCDWLKIRLVDQGIPINIKYGLSEILLKHESELEFVRQHIKPIKKWNNSKDECYNLSSKLNGRGSNDDHLLVLIEKTAFEGQILWLTIQDS